MKTNFKHVIIHRAFLSNYVHSSMRRSYNPFTYLEEAVKVSIVADLTFIYCHCDKKTLKKRFIESNEKNFEKVDAALYYFEEGIKFLKDFKSVKILRINTSRSIDECIKKIVRRIKK